MSSSDRRWFLISGAALLAGCGFAPVYGPGGAAEGLRGQVTVAAPSDRDAYELVKRLEQRLGQPTDPRYELAYSIRTEEIGVAITPEQETTRYNVVGQADFTLTDTMTGSVVTTGSVDSFASYGATGSTVSTLSATRDARVRLMIILADQMVTRLVATAAEWRS